MNHQNIENNIVAYKN